MTDSSPSPSAAPHLRRCVWLWVLPLAFGWLKLIDHLRLEWSVNAQYAYGWAVPCLCALLAWRAAQRTGEPTTSNQRDWPWWTLAGLGALWWLPARLIGEANPDWRFVSWAMAGAIVGLTLATLHLGLGARDARRFAFPVLFILIAVPWPTVFEGPLVQVLTRFNAAACVEVLGLIGIPALQHGNVIEISTGVVGIEEACSGIRSLQASLMIALFLGEYERLRRRHRLGLIAAGFALAMFFNLCRTTLLVVVASRQGIDAIGRWHDPAGITILIGCFLGVWAVAAWLKRCTAAAEPTKTTATWPKPLRCGLGAGALLLAWLVGVELGVSAWYRSHERHATAQPVWTVQWPTNAAQFRELPLTEQTRQFLRYDEAGNARWLEADGTGVQIIFLRWEPGRVAAKLARNHTPEACLTAAGGTLQGRPERRQFTANGLPMEFEVYQFEGLRAYYCLWSDHATQTESSSLGMTYSRRWEAVRRGQRNLGQRSLEIAVWTRELGAVTDARIAARLPVWLRIEQPR
jgi:exosortase